ncbi:hypothetical protein A3306_05180 [Rickettsia bellii]|nr:hypothetical protein A3306_05180 [Rickettsia bellii]
MQINYLIRLLAMYKQILKNIENKIESNNMTLKTLEWLKIFGFENAKREGLSNVLLELYSIHTGLLHKANNKYEQDSEAQLKLSVVDTLIGDINNFLDNHPE